VTASKDSFGGVLYLHWGWARGEHAVAGMQPSEGMRFLMETPETHCSRESQAFIQQEIDRPSKAWVQEVVRSDRESEFVKLRTEDFVLLPDLNGHRRQARAFRARPLQLLAAGAGAGNWPRYESGWKMADWKQQGGVERDWKHQGGIERDWKHQGGVERDWKHQGGIERDWKHQGGIERDWKHQGGVDRDWKHQGGVERDWKQPTPREAPSQGGLFGSWRGGETQPQHNRARSWPIEGGCAEDANAADAAAAKSIAPRQARHRFNWLAIVADPSLRSVRDLRGEHVGMLERLYEQCVSAIQKEYAGVGEGDIMVFANYPPSVYKLHFHFCVPFFQPTAYDAFRMHSLSGIINNLRVHPLYYKVSTLQIPVHSGSELYRAMRNDGAIINDKGRQVKNDGAIINDKGRQEKNEGGAITVQ
jgi:hypothetical protein